MSTSQPLRGPVRVPGLLIAWEPWHRTFLRNLADLFRAQPKALITARPAAYWKDALVTRQMKPKHFVLSTSWHAFGILFIYMLPMLLVVIPRPVEIQVAKRETPVYAPLSDYLPAVNSGSAPAKVARKGRPKLAKQEIVSLPPNPDNFEQTIVSPPNPKILKQHVNLPNMVMWNPDLGPAPVQATSRNVAQMKVPRLDPQVVQPAPADVGREKLHFPVLPQPAVLMPAAEDAKRPIGEMNIAQLDATVAEPVIALPAQRAVPGMGGGKTTVVPAPSLSSIAPGDKDSKGVGQIVALGLYPRMPNGPIRDPGGSRHGEFAAGPKGSPDAPGTPDVAGGGTASGGHGTGTGGAGTGSGSGLPGGVYVGAPPPGASVGPVAGDGLGSPGMNGPGGGSGGPGGRGNPGEKDRNTLASLSKPKVTDIPRASTSKTPATDNAKIEDQVFGGKKYYQMAVNLPNLTSAGGSWIIRFAELNPSPEAKGDLAAPAVVLKVDPAYSGEALRLKIEGTVILYAIIHADGTVGEVRVLRGLDEKLDHNATVALTRWKFRPASRNGVAEDVEAVVTIPFRISKLF